MFEFQPMLTGRLTHLRPLRRDDFETLYQTASDPDIWAQHPQSNRYERDVFQKFFDSGLQSKGALVVISKSTGELIGSSRYYGLNMADSQVIIGYTFLKKSFWGGKYNHELKGLMLGHAFHFVDSVLFEIGDKNLRSRKAIEKIGASLLRLENLDEKPHVVYKLDRIRFKEIFGNDYSISMKMSDEHLEN